jgi:hypothetical protein
LLLLTCPENLAPLVNEKTHACRFYPWDVTDLKTALGLFANRHFPDFMGALLAKMTDWAQQKGTQ